MNSVAINFGSIMIGALVFYFVIKAAVKNGINDSNLFSSSERNRLEYEELKASFKAVGKEVPDFLKKEEYEGGNEHVG